MYEGRTKKFRDTIHGYIDIPDIIVSNIIDTEQFQRLKYIEQTSMRSLYPAARHDRFIHSLGVYWLGKQAFAYFRQNSQKVLLEEEKKELTEVWWNKQEILFSLSCLLHDCAHAPFSHTLENMYVLRKKSIKAKNALKLKDGSIIAELDYRLLEECESDEEFLADFLDDDNNSLQYNGIGAPHEKMSAYSVITEYKEAIKRIGQLFLDESITDKDLVFIVRMIIGCTYKNSDFIASVKNCIISMLNSSSIDVDGLDYIVRDAYMSGIDNYHIDYQRLLSSFVMIPIEVFNNMKGQNADIDGIWLKGTELSVERFSVDSISGKLIINGLKKSDEKNIKGIGCEVFVVEGTCSTKLDDEIQIQDIRNGTIQLTESCKLHKSNFSGTIIQGKKIHTTLHEGFLGNNHHEYILGYDKKALSIIDGAIEARNHEYLWVYTHPKVLYNSNYLQCELLRDSAKYLCCSVNNKQFKDKKLMFKCEECAYYKKGSNKNNNTEDDFLLYIIGYDNYFKKRVKSSLTNSICKKMQNKGFIFQQTCDDDLNALFKRIYIENAERGELKSDKIDMEFQEFFSRRHKKPLWKSFVEYDNFLKMCEENSSTKDVIPRFCEEVLFKANAKGNNYASPNQEQQKIFEEYGLTDVVVIKASVKTKELNPNETLIKFQDQTLRLRDIFMKENLKSKMSKDFYYIFANMEKTLTNEKFLDMVKKLDI